VNAVTTAAQFVSIISFLAYGASCLLSKKMIVEFRRYQMPQLRLITGALQIFASIVLAVGFFYPVLAAAASFGLGLQMVIGLGVRVRIKDKAIEMMPALFFCLLNFFIFWQRYGEL
jgi:hypothetical protein